MAKSTKPEGDAPQDPNPMANEIKYRFKGKNDVKAISYPGFNATLTIDHLNGPDGELFIRVLKKLDKKSGTDNFSKFIEEVK